MDRVVSTCEPNTTGRDGNATEVRVSRTPRGEVARGIQFLPRNPIVGTAKCGRPVLGRHLEFPTRRDGPGHFDVAKGRVA